MASVYKRSRKKPIPRGAKILESRGKRYAVWTSRGGRKRKAPLTDDGQAVEIQDADYSVSWWSWNGKRKRLSGGPDKDAAEALGARMEALEMQRRTGTLDPRQERLADEGRRSLESHLADYEAHLRAGKPTEKHIRSTLKFIREVVGAAGFATLGDLSADPVNRYASDLTAQGRAARTVQAHLAAIKGFTRWLARHGKLPQDPLASIRKPDPKTDRRRERRMLLPDEWGWLRSVTLADNRQRNGMEAQERVLLYATAIQTGLRSGELRSLTRGRLYLDSAPPYVTCKAGSTKNRKEARQYIQADVADGLRQHIATKAPAAPVFGMPHETGVAKMLRGDLADARREWLTAAEHDPQERLRREQSDFLAVVNHEGEVLDFHGLRHTCGAWAAMSGAHPKAVQSLMRHSTIVLTMDTYGHLFPGQEAETVARLPEMLGDGPEALRATGTCDATAADAPGFGAAVGAAVTRLEVAKQVPKWPDVDSRPAGGDSPQVLTLAGHKKSRRVLATSGPSSGAGTRTPDTRIMIPLL